MLLFIFGIFSRIVVFFKFPPLISYGVEFRHINTLLAPLIETFIEVIIYESFAIISFSIVDFYEVTYSPIVEAEKQ